MLFEGWEEKNLLLYCCQLIVGKMTSVNLPVNVIGSPASMLISLFFVCENAIQLWFLLGCTNSNFYIDKALCFKYL